MASNEDNWSEISDPIIRKRVQNRLAQRNYRKNHKTRVNELERQLAEQSYNPIYSPNMIQGEMLRSLQRHYMQFGQMPFQGLDQQPGLRPLLPSHLNNPAHQETPKTLGNRADEMQDSGRKINERKRKRVEQLAEVPLSPAYTNAMYEMEWGINCKSSDASTSYDIGSSQLDSRIQAPLQSDPKLPEEHNVPHLEHREHPLKKNASLTKRLEHVLESIKQAGFDGVESMISTYYTSDFRPSSRLASSQHLSRNRKLPEVLSKLRTSAMTWTKWEAQGYNGEIVRSAESILAAERKTLVTSPILKEYMEKYESRDLPEKGDEEGFESASINAIFQQEAPHLWTLISSLTAENGYEDTKDDVQYVPALMALLCYPGGISHGKLNAALKRHVGTCNIY